MTKTADKKPIVVGIAGGTGAGKTTISTSVYADLGGSANVAYLNHDDYYRDITHLSVEERSRTNFDHPDSLETELLTRHVEELRDGRAVDVPKYDFSRHARTGEVTTLESRRIILVEGILIFSDPKLVDLLDFKVYVDTDADIRLMRRITRDTSSRGRTVAEVMHQYSNTVRPMHEQFVEPSKRVADVIVLGDGDRPNVALRVITNHLRAEAGFFHAEESGREG